MLYYVVGCGELFSTMLNLTNFIKQNILFNTIKCCKTKTKLAFK